MRKLLVLVSTLAVAACSAGNAQRAEGESGGRAQASRDYQAGAFDRIQLTGSPDLVVTVGGQPSIRAEGDAELLERLEITAENGQLRIGLREGTRNWFGRNRGLTVHITMPALAGAVSTGSGDIAIDRVQGQRFAATLTGSGDIEIGTIEVGEAEFEVRGSGGIKAAGRAGRAAANLSGSGDLDLARFEAAEANVALAGSGDIAMRATRTAAVSLAGSGDINIAGTARCTVTKSGSGDVRCGG